MSTEVHQAVETVTTLSELDLLFGPLFDEYFNGENQVVSKSSAVTTTDASNKRQQQPDSTSSTSTLATLSLLMETSICVRISEQVILKYSSEDGKSLLGGQHQQALVGLDEGCYSLIPAKAGFYKPTAHTQSFKVNHSTSQSR
ncbi:hypothetical protein Tco_0770460 [Tanacetum coccineum]|uniref:Uncharacterized protein n=1 Tax=Tanacetum coccineum TaxID=301880 RepID=A0ABQ4ZCA5_9ASTR